MSTGRKIGLFVTIAGIVGAIVMFVAAIVSLIGSSEGIRSGITATSFELSTYGYAGSKSSLSLTLNNTSGWNFTNCVIRIDEETANGTKVLYESEEFYFAANSELSFEFQFQGGNLLKTKLIFSNLYDKVDTVLYDFDGPVLLAGSIIVGLISVIAFVVVLATRKRKSRQHGYSPGAGYNSGSNYRNAPYGCGGNPVAGQGFGAGQSFQQQVGQTVGNGICKNCGAQNSSGSKFCAECGKRLE